MKDLNIHQLYVVLLFILCLLVIFFFKYLPLKNPPFAANSSGIEQQKTPPIVVEIAGEIEKPGIYCFEHTVDLGEVVERAGGLTRTAVLSKESLSMELTNAAKVTIGTGPSSVRVEMMEPEKRFLYFIPININTAGADELLVVPGIGEKTAYAIIHHRQAHGNFLTLDELKDVPGIGNDNFTKMKDYLTTSLLF